MSEEPVQNYLAPKNDNSKRVMMNDETTNSFFLLTV